MGLNTQGLGQALHIEHVERNMITIGHRGAAGYEPENTLRSIRKALELEAHWIEVDVYYVDGHLMVFHDDTLSRTTNGAGRIQEQNFAYLRTLDAGKGEQIPTLDEVIACIDHRAGLNVELKGPATAAPVTERLTRAVAEEGYAIEDFLVSSFDHAQLVAAQAFAPDVRIGVLMPGWPLKHTKLAEDMGAYSVNLHLRTVTQELVDDAHDRGLRVWIYTVNQPEDIARMRHFGVDGIFTDYPDRALVPATQV